MHAQHSIITTNETTTTYMLEMHISAMQVVKINYVLQFKSGDFTPRTPETYNYHCSLLNGSLTKETSTIYGITHNSPLNELSNFHVVDQLPQDVMHILLEGVVPYELALMLASFIDQKYLVVELFNDRITCFAYSTQEAKNIPSPIKPRLFTSHGVSLNQSCELHQDVSCH